MSHLSLSLDSSWLTLPGIMQRLSSLSSLDLSLGSHTQLALANATLPQLRSLTAHSTQLSLARVALPHLQQLSFLDCNPPVGAEVPATTLFIASCSLPALRTLHIVCDTATLACCALPALQHLELKVVTAARLERLQLPSLTTLAATGTEPTSGPPRRVQRLGHAAALLTLAHVDAPALSSITACKCRVAIEPEGSVAATVTEVAP